MKIRMKVIEEVEYEMDVEVPDDFSRDWDEELDRDPLEEIWNEQGHPIRHFVAVHDRHITYREVK